MVGFAILQGPLAHLKHILTAERLPFTGAYLGSLFLTLYFSVIVSLVFICLLLECITDNFLISSIQSRSYLLTLIFAIIQCGALVSYLVAYFPYVISFFRLD